MALLAITCKCGHIGVVAERILPCDVTCSRCGNVQYVARLNRASITEKATVMADAWSNYKTVCDRAEQRLRRIEQRNQKAAAARSAVVIATEVRRNSR